MFRFGIDQLLNSADQINYLKSKRCALVAHPASVTADLTHSLDALFQKNCPIDVAFGPQHGMRGDKQDNMIETEDYLDPQHQIKIISLYSEHRRPTAAMLKNLDVILFDLQDVGCRIYTYISTLKYFLEACAQHNIECWVLDRPNPAGRAVDGLRLEPDQTSFVGCDVLPTRHGLTMAELALWFKASNQLTTKLTIIPMHDYNPDNADEYGWPNLTPWVNPSPNASSVNMARCFSGTVLLEGTELSEGRGTTTPLEVIGAPDFPAHEILALLEKQAPQWLSGVHIRPCFFTPTFHKHQSELCAGLQVHTGATDYEHNSFKPYRFIAGCLKALRLIQPDYPIWRDFYYEYESDRLPIDVINGGSALRLWVDDLDAGFADFDAVIEQQMAQWLKERSPHLLY
jgi:uncharacterized protein YbbC (DUF1343 family)